MSNQHETSKPIMAADVMKRIEALELGYRDAKATNAEIQEDVDRIDEAVAELLEWCKRLSRETAEPATKAETQPPIVGPKREAVEPTAQQGFDCWHMLSNCASGEEPGAIQAWLAKNSLRLVRDTPSEAETPTPTEPPLLKAGDPCPRFPEHGRLREWSDGLYCYDCQAWYRPEALRRWAEDDAKAETIPPPQWVDWRDGMTLEDGRYPVVLRGNDAVVLFARGFWRWDDGCPIGSEYITHYLPIRIPDPPRRD